MGHVAAIGLALRRLSGLLLVFAAVGVPTAHADDSLEYRVKAAFLLNFTKFVEWPPEAFAVPDSPIVICVLGENPFGNNLDQLLAGETVNGRKVVTQNIRRAPAAKSCQLVFVAKSEREIPRTLSALGRGVLSVGEGDTFLRDGGMIAFEIENRRVRFVVNQTRAENAGLKLSSKLLSVAKAVEQ